MVSKNININIGSQSISYAIDAQLDKELGQDVKLNSAQWNSVFGILKEDQSVQKQNESVANNVNAPNTILQISQKAWNSILNIAKNSLNNTEETGEDSFAEYLQNGENGEKPEEISVDNSSVPNLKADLLNKSSYIMNYDLNGDNRLQFGEYLEMEMASSNLENVSDEDKALYKNTFKKLDINKDGGIDNSEMASYYATMATVNDTKKTGGTWNNITYDEWKEAQTRLADDTSIADYLPLELLQKFNEASEKNGKTPSPEELFPADNNEYDEVRKIYTDWYNSAQLQNRMKNYYNTVFKDS